MTRLQLGRRDMCVLDCLLHACQDKKEVQSAWLGILGLIFGGTFRAPIRTSSDTVSLEIGFEWNPLELWKTRPATALKGKTLKIWLKRDLLIIPNDSKRPKNDSHADSVTFESLSVLEKG